MRLLSWYDAAGYLRHAWVRDTDTLEMAQQGQGLPADPPDVTLLDWTAVQRELHNALARARLLTATQMQTSTAPLINICVQALKRELLRVYREQRSEGGEAHGKLHFGEDGI